MAVEEAEQIELQIRARIRATHNAGHGLPEIALIVNRPLASVASVLSDELAGADRPAESRQH